MPRLSKEDVLNEKEREDLINSCKNDKELFVIKGLLYTGMRAGEFSHMLPSWLDYQRDVIHIPKHEGEWKPKTKSGSREIPMLYEVKKLLYDYFQHNERIKHSRVNLFRIVKNVGERLTPKKKVYPHSLRATFATMMAERGMGAADIQYIMGWAKLETANSYVRSTKAVDNFQEKMRGIK